MNGEFLCNQDWDSEIDGEDDGFFDLDIDEGTGDITGTHFVGEEEYDVHGICLHPTDQSRVHFITLFEFRGSTLYRYRGEIVPDNTGAGRHKVPAGKRRRLFGTRLREQLERRERRGPKRPLVDNDWTAEKAT